MPQANKLGEQGCEALAEALGHADSRVLQLSLARNELGERAATTLVRGLMARPAKPNTLSELLKVSCQERLC